MIHKYTEEEKQFIYDNYKGRSTKELTTLFNEKFGTNITDRKIRYYKHNNHLNSGLSGQFQKGHETFNKGKKWDDYMPKKSQEKSRKTTFKKGNIPQNHKPIGSERINVYGYSEIKVADSTRWKLKHRYIYEQNFGPIPKGYDVVFADRNKQNFDLDNLILVSKAEKLFMNNNGLIFQDKELTKTGHLIAKVSSKTSELTKR